jgi:hypothetical protein
MNLINSLGQAMNRTELLLRLTEALLANPQYQWDGRDVAAVVEDAILMADRIEDDAASQDTAELDSLNLDSLSEINPELQEQIERFAVWVNSLKKDQGTVQSPWKLPGVFFRSNPPTP